MHTIDVCYVCGCQGISQITQTRANNESSKIPCFPSLLLVSAAANAKPPSPIDGHVRLCLLCWRLLAEQWKAYEKRKVPLSNRQYWFKCCSANRESIDSGPPSRTGTRGNINQKDCANVRSRSQSPNSPMNEPAAPDQHSRSASLIVGDMVDIFNQESRRDTTSKSTTVDGCEKPTCVVCTRHVESMDVCRRLPAHLVAQVIDLKPAQLQARGQLPVVPNLTGEALVCDECFATPSFQSAWLDCCRRGNLPTHASPVTGLGQRQQPSSGETASVPDAIHIQHLNDAQRQWFAAYERALMQFRFTGQLDPLMMGQLQRLAAAEALASLQHAGNIVNQDMDSVNNAAGHSGRSA